MVKRESSYPHLRVMLTLGLCDYFGYSGEGVIFAVHWHDVLSDEERNIYSASLRNQVVSKMKADSTEK